MSLIVRKSSVSEIASSPNFQDLLEEYAVESAIHGLPHPSAKMDIYYHLESVNFLYPIAAFLEDVLIGFILVLTPVMPHYGKEVSVSESFFVAKEYRKTGAGTKLRNAAEEHVKDIKSLGLLISAPLGSILAEVLPSVGYKETNRVFFRSFNGE